MQTFIRIHPKDSVAVALQPLSNGTVIRLDDLQFTLKEDIPQGHKFALLPYRRAKRSLKYGAPIELPLRESHRKLGAKLHNPENRIEAMSLPYILISPSRFQYGKRTGQMHS